MTLAAVRPFRPTRTPSDDQLDLPPCHSVWGPLDCAHGLRHACWTWTGWPHICRCTRCASQEGAGR